MIAVLLLELRLPKQPLMGAQFNCSHRLDRATHLTSTALRANEPSDRKEWVPAATSIDHAFHNRDLILQYSIDDAFHECFDSRPTNLIVLSTPPVRGYLRLALLPLATASETVILCWNRHELINHNPETEKKNHEFFFRQHQSADQQHPIALDILWGRGIDSIRNMPEGTRTPELELRPPREVYYCWHVTYRIEQYPLLFYGGVSSTYPSSSIKIARPIAKGPGRRRDSIRNMGGPLQ
ncbi:hypothetical protein SUGI_1475830 [Cryptomeria japonica]|uniref:Uncharacterized protein n=1 Tax=Cryptomeria japonica TaxID=3369 RepID=A0AAD3RRD6_CRYJA|nr:hypothetical protein SUGI_1475830 [Cryptomeria japonica]